MKIENVANGNTMFFVATVGICIGMEYFSHTVLNSSLEASQFPTDKIGGPGYIKVDSSAIRKKGEYNWYEFTEKIRKDLLGNVAFGFSSATKFDGDFAEKVTIKKDGYVFCFHVKQYERDQDHNFQFINPEDLDTIPEDEALGRVVYLTIKLDEKKI